MQACERSDKVPERKTSHTHYLAGVYRGGHNIIFREKMAIINIYSYFSSSFKIVSCYLNPLIISLFLMSYIFGFEFYSF